MKVIIINILLLFFLSAEVSGQPCSADVKIVTNKKFSQLFVDDHFRGEGAVQLRLSKGIHSIYIQESKYGWGNEVIHEQIIIEECNKEYSYNYFFDEKVLLNSDPQDAAVYLNDSLIGHTPLFLNTKGIEYMDVGKPNYKSQLVQLDKYKVNTPIELESIKIEADGSFIKSSWFKVLFGSAVALGTAAAYFKIKADNRYKKYIETRDRKYLDETDKLDLYSGLAFGALQINFGLLIYYFITE